MNALVLLSILLDAALLSSFNVNGVEAVLKSTPCWYVACGITIAWLVVMSMPHAMSQDGCLKCLGLRETDPIPTTKPGGVGSFPRSPLWEWGSHFWEFLWYS